MYIICNINGNEVIDMKKKMVLVIIIGLILFSIDFINVAISKRVISSNIDVQTISKTYQIEDQMFSNASYIKLTNHFFASTKGYELINVIDDNYVRLRISKKGFMPRMKSSEAVDERKIVMNDTTIYTYIEYSHLPDTEECGYWITLNFYMNEVFYTCFFSPNSSSLPQSIIKGSVLIDDVIIPYVTNQMEQIIHFD